MIRHCRRLTCSAESGTGEVNGKRAVSSAVMNASDMISGEQEVVSMTKLLLSVLILFVIPVCASPSAVLAGDLTVSAAISLKNAFKEIGKPYEAKNAGNLARQRADGVPVDVFASAAQRDRDDLVAGKVKRVASGHPKTVSTGRYAAKVFDYYRMAAVIKDKLIYSENVCQVLDYVARDEVDAGVEYGTDAAARSSAVHVAAEAPAASHKPVIYPIAAVKATKKEESATSFIDMVRSKEGSAILKKYGFRLS